MPKFRRTISLRKFLSFRGPPPLADYCHRGRESEQSQACPPVSGSFRKFCVHPYSLTAGAASGGPVQLISQGGRVLAAAKEKGLPKAPFGLLKAPLQLPEPLFELLPTPFQLLFSSFQLPFLYKNFIIIRRIHNNIKGFRDIGIDRGPCTAAEKYATRACACARTCMCMRKNRRFKHGC